MLALLFLGISAFHFASAYGIGPASKLTWGGRTAEHYALLTDAFLAGRTSLLVRPDPELLALSNPYDPVANVNYRLHDASLYGGKYYLYFGPAPAIVLFVPYKVLTGSHLPARAAVALFCIGGFACSCALFFLLVKREKWVCPFWLAATAVLSIGNFVHRVRSAHAALMLRSRDRLGILFPHGRLFVYGILARFAAVPVAGVGHGGALLRAGCGEPSALRLSRRSHDGSGVVQMPSVQVWRLGICGSDYSLRRDSSLV